MLLISTHFGDGLLSAFSVLEDARARALVLTVRGGVPADDSSLSSWDRRCGFTSATCAARARGADDEAACAALGVRAVHLPFADGPYTYITPDELCGAVRSLLDDRDNLWLPLGIGGHSDTAEARHALLALAKERPPERSVFYADSPYAGVSGWHRSDGQRRPSLRWDGALEALAELGVELGPQRLIRLPRQTYEAKLQALRHCASQVDALQQIFPQMLSDPEVLGNEGYWSVSAWRSGLAQQVSSAAPVQ